MNVSTKLVVACALLASLTACDKGKKATVQDPVRVKVESVDSTSVAGSRTYSGTVEESSGTVLSFAAVGTIQQLNVNVGDRVSRGQLIGTLDAASLQNAYDIANSTLASALDAYNRMKQLHDAQALPDMKWVEVQNALKQAQSAANIARHALNDARLYAPTSGYVSERPADVGMNAAPGIPVVKIVDINPVKVSVPVPENQISSISDGSAAMVTVSALGGETFEGKLTEKGVAASPLSRSYAVKYTVPNPDGKLLPGMICDVTLESAPGTRELTVPIDAVLLDADNQQFVWLVVDGKAQKRNVEVDGLTSGTRLAIKSGLSQGEQVIVAGQQKVSTGTPVEVVE